jgi:hypothetical protein
MATSYRIEVGYNSQGNEEDAWSDLLSIVNSIRDEPSRIVDEVLRVELDCDAGLIRECAACYSKSNADMTLTIVDTVEGGENVRFITQCASGGGECRLAKESCRRAFCRLVMESMHRLNREVNVIVS